MRVRDIRRLFIPCLPAWLPGADPRPSANGLAYPLAATNRASIMRCRRSLLVAVGRCGCCHRCSHPRGASAPGTFPPGLRPWCAAPPPSGLTAADLFAGGEVSRADSRVRSPGIFTCARCPAVRSALDAVPEAYHNPAAVWWGAFAASAVIRDQVVIAEPVTGSHIPSYGGSGEDTHTSTPHADCRQPNRTCTISLAGVPECLRRQVAHLARSSAVGDDGRVPVGDRCRGHACPSSGFWGYSWWRTCWLTPAPVGAERKGDRMSEPDRTKLPIRRPPFQGMSNKTLRSVRDFARKEWPLRGSPADVSCHGVLRSAGG